MGMTNFSGPITAGNIRNTTGTTVGTNVENVGFVLMAQSAVIDVIGATATTPVAVIPANSQIVDCILNVTTANDDSNAAAVTVGITGNTNAFIPSTSAKTAATTRGTIETVGTDIGSTDVQVNAYFTATDGDGANGAATVTVIYLQANNLTA
jgi:hypothetical protein